MSKVNVDAAFEWFMVIIGIVFSIISAPMLYWTSADALPAKLQATRQLVFPLLLIAFIWLAGKLMINKNTQVALKLIAWMIALAFAVVNISMWGLGSDFILDHPLVELIAIVFQFVINPAFVYGIVVPRYKEVYPNSTFLQSKIRLPIVYIMFLLFVLATILFV